MRQELFAFWRFFVYPLCCIFYLNLRAPIKNHDAAPHEFAHLLGLKDRYAEYTQQNKSGRSIICSEPFSGWDGNIMAERNNGKVEQRNIDAIFKGLNVDKLDNLIKRKNDFKR